MTQHNYNDSIEACAAHYGDEAEAVKTYMQEGLKQALRLPNRGPIQFLKNGAPSSGVITIRSTNSGTSGVSGMLVFSSGTAVEGNSGSILIGTGAATSGRGGLVSISAGSGTSGVGGLVSMWAGKSTTLAGGLVSSLPAGPPWSRPSCPQTALLSTACSC